eukprot:gene5611-6469_t
MELPVLDKSLPCFEVCLVSCQEKERLVGCVREALERVEESSSWVDFCRSTTAESVVHSSVRVAFLARDKGQLMENMRAYCMEAISPEIVVPKEGATSGSVGFVLGGNGSQMANMSAGLYAASATFRKTFDHCDRVWKELAGWSIHDRIYNLAEGDMSIHETTSAQPCTFALQVSLVAVLANAGVNISAVVGISLGEVAAAHVAGVLSLEDAFKLLQVRSTLQHSTAGTGMVLVSRTTRDITVSVLESCGMQDRVGVCIANEQSVVVAGDIEAINIFNEALIAASVATIPVPSLNIGFHSAQLDHLKDDFYKQLPVFTYNAPVRPYFSSSLNCQIDAYNYTSLINKDYWWQNLRGEVHLMPQIRNLINTVSPSATIEVSSHPHFSIHIVPEMRANQYCLYAMSHAEHNTDTLQNTLAHLFVNGLDVNWTDTYPPSTTPLVRA